MRFCPFEISVRFGVWSHRASVRLALVKSHKKIMPSRCGSRVFHCRRRSITLSEFRDFLELPYAELEDLNLQAKEQRKKRVAADVIQEERLRYLTDERRIKAVTVVFSDLEGRLHMLDYDKKFLVKSYNNLTFAGSSIPAFAAQRESE